MFDDECELRTLDAQVFVRIGFGKAFELLLRLAVAGIGCGDVVELFSPLDIGEVEFAQQRRLLVPLDRIVAGETARRIDRQAVAALDQHGHALAVVGDRVKRRGGGDVLQFEPVVARVVERHRIDQGGLAARRKLFDVDLPASAPTRRPEIFTLDDWQAPSVAAARIPITILLFSIFSHVFIQRGERAALPDAGNTQYSVSANEGKTARTGNVAVRGNIPHEAVRATRRAESHRSLSRFRRDTPAATGFS